MQLSLSNTSGVQIVAAYSTGKEVVQGVAESPGWIVLGGFHLTQSVTCRLEALGQVSGEGLTLRVRLFDMTALEVVGAPVQIVSVPPVRRLGGQVSLTGGRHYQVQAECVGGTDETDFGVVPSVTLTE